jgi:predicted NUDIX family phosphoesterase
MGAVVKKELADRRLILAIEAAPLNALAEAMGQKFIHIDDLAKAGVIATTVDPLIAVCEFLADCGVWMGPRRTLEEMPDLRQLIPYVVLAQAHELEPRYLVYSRAGDIEEQRLANRLAIGWGGHIDFCDLQMNDCQQINVTKTVQEAARRELLEECGLVGWSMEPYGLIVSDDETGRVHVGLVMIAEVFGTVVSKEDSQLNLEWLTPEQIIQRDGHEGWTTLVAEELSKRA